MHWYKNDTLRLVKGFNSTVFLEMFKAIHQKMCNSEANNL